MNSITFVAKLVSMKKVNVQELKGLLDNKADIQLIDVREAWENEMANIGGELIPMGDVVNNIDKIATDKKVVVYCRSGQRSANVIMMLEQMHQLDNLYNLEGGILSWADQIDPSVPKY